MIPQEAIEAAEQAIRKEMESQAYDRHTYTRIALEAAAPFLRAQALEDAAKYVEYWIKAGADDSISPDETRKWLRARAATERGQA